jgi:hypothetical protein
MSGWQMPALPGKFAPGFFTARKFWTDICRPVTCRAATHRDGPKSQPLKNTFHSYRFSFHALPKEKYFQ